jgi:hypothetical protein
MSPLWQMMLMTVATACVVAAWFAGGIIAGLACIVAFGIGFTVGAYVGAGFQV